MAQLPIEVAVVGFATFWLLDYFVTGGAGKVRQDPPGKTAEAHTVSWAAACQAPSRARRSRGSSARHPSPRSPT